jgi:thiosulfate/3-mercaptopyruvate sulfurtransferase
MTLLLALALATYAHPEMLVETDWLAAHLTDRSIRIVDMRMSAQGSPYAAGHIPGAVELAKSAIRISTPPTFVPSPPEFERLMGRLGISNATRVIVYDDRGGIYAARLWWILNYYGHTNVALLNGGWTRWTKEGRAVSTEAPAIEPAVFKAAARPAWLATADDVVAAIGKPGVKIVDARTLREIEGQDLRGIRRGGHVPSAVPVYWEDTLDPELRTFRPAAEIEKLYRDRGILPSDRIITYCQIGMRASHDVFTARLVGYENAAVYYGSWEEWGNRDDLPLAGGPRP